MVRKLSSNEWKTNKFRCLWRTRKYTSKMLDFQFLKKVNKRYSSLNYNKSLNYSSKCTKPTYINRWSATNKKLKDVWGDKNINALLNKMKKNPNDNPTNNIYKISSFITFTSSFIHMSGPSEIWLFNFSVLF